MIKRKAKTMNIKTMTTEQIMDIGNNHNVVWDYYVSTLRGFDGYSRLYLNKETGEIFEVYEASQNTWLEGDDIIQICGTSALGGANLNEDELESLEDWCGDWYSEWYNGYFEDVLIETIDNI